MTVEPSILTRRKLSPERLRAARLAAGQDNVSALCRRIGIKRLAYTRWEQAPGLTHFDFVAFHNLLNVLNVSYTAVTDEIPADEQSGGDIEQLPPLPTSPRQLSAS